ncbi:hypothetical protein CO051_01240 [Candidatus Roizmanbacteria bacterium CG_4_9_14_0_2_um_filter_39_13]|uniref:Uncharacterized protein n=1 Tax=Candidatus Roizmanbacteria bacterium CG_4_9_14_0_2_um_filter_39_13 TaxID=1974839 RepID=A0A2M8F311_9BACT|nr:MAG: hypothetical protein COY15_03640 [Candidatus Roizmanbacteria bacterium CG_4_10_14_0_2_um_filter_39_12]PJC33676.1 MAG: hypothetical protein CO051_01240 [Candidatus Roizmanbacteria bacterium CG_4_9_14_0_2_um_filter_39_13]
MIYTKIINKAITFTTKIHEIDTKKKRKGKDIPYITHSLAVGLILARVTKDENIIALEEIWADICPGFIITTTYEWSN